MHVTCTLPKPGASSLCTLQIVAESAIFGRWLWAHTAGELGMYDPWVRKISREGNSNLLQYSCLKNSIDRGAWQATVYRVAELDTTNWLTLSLFKNPFKLVQNSVKQCGKGYACFHTQIDMEQSGGRKSFQLPLYFILFQWKFPSEKVIWKTIVRKNRHRDELSHLRDSLCALNESISIDSLQGT